jgi:hypothetical protein
MNRNNISEFICSGILTKTFLGYKCQCGSYCSRFGVKKHIHSKKHIQWMINNWINITKICMICYRNKYDFYTCSVCKNHHCNDCHEKMSKCPFCRNKFMIDELNFIITVVELVDEVFLSEDTIIISELFNLCMYLYENKYILQNPRFLKLRQSLKKRLIQGYIKGWEFCEIFIQLIEL